MDAFSDCQKELYMNYYSLSSVKTVVFKGKSDQILKLKSILLSIFLFFWVSDNSTEAL